MVVEELLEELSAFVETLSGFVDGLSVFVGVSFVDSSLVVEPEPLEDLLL